MELFDHSLVSIVGANLLGLTLLHSSLLPACLTLPFFRAGEGDFLFTGKSAKELHPLLMGFATLFFFIGGWAGVGSMALQG